jgi:hypothetical protein
MKDKNKRSYPRATTLLPFQVRRLSLNEFDGLDHLDCRLSLGGIVIEDSPPPPTGDERLDLWLNMLNTKLDYLIRLNAPKQVDTVSMDFEPLNISGSGMSLVAKEQFKKGDILEIRMVLQTYPAKVLHLYGKVIRAEATPNKSGSYTTGIQFVGLNESVRDEILKFDFKKHRERLITQSKKAS